MNQENDFRSSMMKNTAQKMYYYLKLILSLLTLFRIKNKYLMEDYFKDCCNEIVSKMYIKV